MLTTDQFQDDQTTYRRAFYATYGSGPFPCAVCGRPVRFNLDEPPGPRTLVVHLDNPVIAATHAACAAPV